MRAVGFIPQIERKRVETWSDEKSPSSDAALVIASGESHSLLEGWFLLALFPGFVWGAEG